MKRYISIVIILVTSFLPTFYANSITNPDSLKNLLCDENTIEQYRFRIKLGDLYITDSPAVAYNHYYHSQNIAEQLKQDTLIALSLNKMGLSKLKTDDYPLSKDYFTRSLAIYEHYKLTDKIAYLNYYLGLSEYYQGNYEQSIKNYQKALKSFTSSGNIKLEANIYQNMGLVHDDLENDSLALVYYKKALKINEKLGEKADIAGLTQNIGLSHIHDGNLDLALTYIQKSYKIFEELKDSEGIGISLSNIGLVFQKQGKYKKALENYQKSLEVFTESDFLIGKIYALHNVGTSYSDLKDYSTALEYYRKSIDVSSRIGHVPGIMTNYEAISKLYDETGDYKSSLEYYILYDNLKDSINSVDAKNKISEMEAIYKLGLMDSELSSKSIELIQQRRQKKIFIAGSFILLILLIFSALAYNQKNIAEKELNRHKVNLEELVKQRTQELNFEINERRIAEESDKLKSAFLANMSHELRTPMNAIIAFTNFLKDKTVSADKREEYVNYITTAGESLLHLIDDIIDIAKIESKELTIKRKSCNITNLSIELFHVFTELKKKKNKDGIELIINPVCYKNSVTVKTDPYRLKQILSNLLENALKYTSKGYVEFGYEISEVSVLFYVRDTGIGIHSSKFEYIFERFSQIDHTTEKQFGGTGLGLAITKNLVELMRGKIWLESRLNKGTTFYFTIPSDDMTIKPFSDSLPITSGKPASFFDYNWNGRTILVAEDEELNYKVLESALCRTNARVVRANNGFEAVDLIKDNNIDMVLMDIQMPGMDGYKATQEIKKINSKIPVIAQTSFAMEGEKEKCIMAGCDDYLSKPLNLNILFGTISRYFN
ncbi:MAG: tetratricopeptide repeat protein [Ignavibacteriaceae bacterium]